MKKAERMVVKKIDKSNAMKEGFWKKKVLITEIERVREEIEGGRKTKDRTRPKFDQYMIDASFVLPSHYVLTVRHLRTKKIMPVLLTSIKGRNWYSCLH